MEVFINELSLNEQYKNIDEFTNAVITFTKIVSTLKNSVCEYNFYKKGDFYWYRKAVLNEDIRGSLNKIKNKSVKDYFIDVVFNKSNPRDWLKEQIHSKDDKFISETLNRDVNGQSLAEISERKLKASDKKYLLLNFQKSAFFEQTSTKIIKNDETNNDIDCVDSIENISLWIETNCIVKPIVEDTVRFERTSKLIKGATIYKEIETGNYWYLDSFHKDHYEVFNSRGEHIGEANLEGYIDTSKKDNSKNGKIDI